jgi:hypothetical protein
VLVLNDDQEVELCSLIGSIHGLCGQSAEKSTGETSWAWLALDVITSKSSEILHILSRAEHK